MAKRPGHENCKFSTGICEYITAGTGRLDDNGYWEFPCHSCAKLANQREAERMKDE